MSDDIRLDLLRDAIADSELDGQTKDALADDLRYAQEINGTDEPSLRGIKRLIISGIRREILAHDRTKKAIQAHESKCSARFGEAEPIKPAAKWLVLLTPWRWPLALVCFSPFAGDIVERVISAFR